VNSPHILFEFFFLGIHFRDVNLKGANLVDFKFLLVLVQRLWHFLLNQVINLLLVETINFQKIHADVMLYFF